VSLSEPHIDEFAMEFVYIYILFCEFLRHSFVQKLFNTNCRTSLTATARTETTCEPTYSMTRAIGATPWQKKVSSIGAIVCVATIAHSQWKSHVTWTDLSNNGHIDELVGESASSV